MMCEMKMEMESKLELVMTTLTAIFVAIYAAIAIRHVARYDLGLSLQEIRSAAVAIAAVMAPFVAIDFLGRQRS